MTTAALEAQHTPLPTADLLIVLGKNIGIGSSQEDIQRRRDHLSPESRLNVLGAGQLWTPGTDILFSTGQTAGPDVPSEASAMRKYFVKHFSGLGLLESHLLTEEQSIDTASNAAEVAKLLADQRYRRIGLVTVLAITFRERRPYLGITASQ